MKEKKSFLVYFDYEEQFAALSDEEFGRLIRASISYARDGVLPEFREKHLGISFSVIKGVIDRDNEKYEKVCERNRINGAKRWEKGKEREN